MFTFHDPGPLVDGELELVLVETTPEDPSKGWVPAYYFQMRVGGAPQPAGSLTLRVGDTEEIVGFFGHIGYGVEPAYRGRRYAARACMLVLPLARLHGLNPLWITCNPDNVASVRTCELLGATLAGVVDVPPGLPLYERGEQLKCRYRLDL